MWASANASSAREEISEWALCVRSCLLFLRYLPLCGESHHFYAFGFETLKIYGFSTLDSSVYIGAADFPS